MRKLRRTLAFGLLAVGCAGTSRSIAPLSPPPPPEILLPSVVDNLPLADCVAQAIAAVARQSANRQQLHEAGSRYAEIEARTRVEQAERARAEAIGSALRAQAAAASNPRDPALQKYLLRAEAVSAGTLAWFESSDSRRVASARAMHAMAGAASLAHRFADLAAAHAELFELATDIAQEGASTNVVQTTSGEKALRSIQTIVTSDPDLEWLYVDRFLIAYQSPSVRCE
jgi:hypothetical protein